MVLSCEIVLFANYNIAEAAKKQKRETPTRIRSDIIDIKRKSETVDFINNVVVEKDDSSLLAQNMTIFYNEKSEGKSAEIKIIKAKDNVRIFSEEFVASGDSGYYDPSKDIFALEKNVVVNNGTSLASGNKFVYNLKTKKGKFIGGSDSTSIVRNGGDERVVVVIGNDLEDRKKQTKKSKNE